MKNKTVALLGSEESTEGFMKIECERSYLRGFDLSSEFHGYRPAEQGMVYEIRGPDHSLDFVRPLANELSWKNGFNPCLASMLALEEISGVVLVLSAAGTRKELLNKYNLVLKIAQLMPRDLYQAIVVIGDDGQLRASSIEKAGLMKVYTATQMNALVSDILQANEVSASTIKASVDAFFAQTPNQLINEKINHIKQWMRSAAAPASSY